jgi:hypothetical protein
MYLSYVLLIMRGYIVHKDSKRIRSAQSAQIPLVPLLPQECSGFACRMPVRGSTALFSDCATISLSHDRSGDRESVGSGECSQVRHDTLSPFKCVGDERDEIAATDG